MKSGGQLKEEREQVKITNSIRERRRGREGRVSQKSSEIIQRNDIQKMMIRNWNVRRKMIEQKGKKKKKVMISFVC